MMNTSLCSKIDKTIEDLKTELHHKSSAWSNIRTPSELFDLEQELQKTLNSFQTKLIGSVISIIHQDEIFVKKCQHQALSANAAYINRGEWVNVAIQTLGGQKTKIRTPYLPPRRKTDPKFPTNNLDEKSSGIFPVLRKLGIIGKATPRLISELNRQLVEGPSAMEARERLINREILYSQKLIWRHMRDFSSIALWQRQEALINLNSNISDSYQRLSLEGKKVVVGLDGGRLRTRINKDDDIQKKHKNILQINVNLRFS